MAAEPQVVRTLTEVVGQEVAAEFKQPQVSRVIGEVVGQEVATRAAQPQITRSAAEVIASASRLSQGLRLPNIAVSEYTLFMQMHTRVWLEGDNHEFGIIAGTPGQGIFLRQGPTLNHLILNVRSGPTGLAQADTTVAVRNDPMTLVVKQNTAAQTVDVRVNGADFAATVSGELLPMTLTNLGGLIEADRRENAAVAQVLLYANLLDVAIIEQIEDYLYCKWVNPGPSEANNFCVPT